MQEISYRKYLKNKWLKGIIRPIGKKKRNVPVEPYAFIRVKNEAVTLEACLNSIKDVIKKGVIAHHKLSPGEKDDGTVEIIKKFIAENPGYKEAYYPYELIPPNSLLYEEFKEKKV